MPIKVVLNAKSLGFKGDNSSFQKFLTGLKQFGDMTVLELAKYNKKSKYDSRRLGRAIG